MGQICNYSLDTTNAIVVIEPQEMILKEQLRGDVDEIHHGPTTCALFEDKIIYRNCDLCNCYFGCTCIGEILMKDIRCIKKFRDESNTQGVQIEMANDQIIQIIPISEDNFNTIKTQVGVDANTDTIHEP
eukprot:548597_1